MPQRPDPATTRPPEGLDESAWVDVVRKMDEVYSQLIADEVALEEKNAALEQSQQFIFGLLASMSDVLVACDRAGDIEETNPALCALVGRGDDALRGTAVAALLADDAERRRMDALVTQARQTPANAELQLVDATGQRVPVDFVCSRRLDAAGRLLGHVFVGRPLGELKRAYQELRQTHEALKQAQQQLLHSEKMASLGRLVAGVAHELNNPISFVLGNMAALRRYAERLRQYLDAVHAVPQPDAVHAARERLRIEPLLADLPSLLDGMSEGAQRTADIVAGLRRFSVVDREERAAVDLAEVVERAIHWVGKGTAPGFDVRWTAPDPPATVSGHAGQLLQVAMNLIQNAADACAGLPGRHLAVTLEAADDGRSWRLVFADDGPGIAPADLSRVFDPFFTTKPVGQGTGLGLSISYGIVERHGGNLTVTSTPGAGARFDLTLPRAPAASAA